MTAHHLAIRPVYKLHSLGLFVAFLWGCAVQNTSSTGQNASTMYQQALSHYEAQRYREALRLFDEALPGLKGKKEEASAYFYSAFCRYECGQYVHAAEDFGYLAKVFPKDARSEQSLYMQGHVLSISSPDFRLDQTLTHEAVSCLKLYLDTYPEGTYTREAEIDLKHMQAKLATKAFANAKLYYVMGYFQAAAARLTHFVDAHADAVEIPEAMYLRILAQDKLLQASHCPDDKPHLCAMCDDFLKAYPQSDHTAEIQNIRARAKD